MKRLVRCCILSLTAFAFVGCSDSDALEDLSCQTGQVAIFDGQDWSCADLNGTDFLGSLSCEAGQVALFDGQSWICSDPVVPASDNDTLAALNCEASQVPTFDGAAWSCTDSSVLAGSDTLGGLECSANDIIVNNGTEWVCGTDQDFFGQLSCNTEDLLVYDGTNWVCRSNAFEELVPTRADAIASPVTASRSDNSMAINHGATDEFDDLAVFPSSDGAGIVAWVEGDDGDEHMYLAYYGPTGGVINQSPVRGDFSSSDTFDVERDATEKMIVVWTPSGDAVIAFLANQGAEPTDPSDSETSRVYFGSFTRTLATTPQADDDVRYGFSRFMAIDSDHEQGIEALYVATNLVDGAWVFSEGDPPFSLERMDGFFESTEREIDSNPYFVSGSHGDDPSNVTPTMFLGWVYRTVDGGTASEGVFVDVGDVDTDEEDTDLLSAVPLPVTLPGLDATERIDTAEIVTSGTDILLSYEDTAGAGQERLFLTRVPVPVSTSPTLNEPVEVSRGVNTNVSSSTIGIHALIGDGYRSVNGETTTWIVFNQRDYTDAVVTNDDRDLLVAQVSADATVSVDEFDHFPADAPDPLDVGNILVQLHPGATRAFIYYQQIFAAPPQSDSSLFVRALRLDGTQTLANNISNEVTLNDSHDSDNNFDSDVDAFRFAPNNAFFGHSANNDTSYVAFRQGVDGSPDALSLKARLVTIVDSTANPIQLSASDEETIVASHDGGYSDTSFDLDSWYVLPGSSAEGHGIVYFTANGNNQDDASAGFVEQRPFVYASSLPNGHSVSAAVQIGSDSAPGGVDFADYRRVAGATYLIQAITTPFVSAERDFTNDDEESIPDQAVFVAEELVRNATESGSQYVTRTLNLRADDSLGSGEERWSPSLSSLPSVMGPTDGEESDDLDGASLLLLPDGNDVVAMFNFSHHEDSGPGEGGYLFANTYNDGAWSDAALLSNDSTFELDDTEQPFHDTDLVFGFAPSFVGGAPQALGSFAFWVRWQHNNGSTGYRFELRGRRLLGTELPRR